MTAQDDRPSPNDVGRRDAAWVEQARAGDKTGFDRLVSAYERRAVALSYRLLGNSTDAMDVAQEAFLRAYRSLDRLKDPARFGPWLLRIVNNLSLNARRSRRSSSTVTLDETQGTDGLTGTGGEPVVTSHSPDAPLAEGELQEALDAALQTLPEKQRTSLVLFALEGWAQKDIAELLDCSLENVKWNVFQARKKLREQLGELFEV